MTMKILLTHCGLVTPYGEIKLGLMIPYGTGLILGLRPANERLHYFVMTSLIGWAQAQNQPSGITRANELPLLVTIDVRTLKIDIIQCK